MEGPSATAEKHCPAQSTDQESWGVSNLVGVSIPIIQQSPDIKIISKTIP